MYEMQGPRLVAVRLAGTIARSPVSPSTVTAALDPHGQVSVSASPTAGPGLLPDPESAVAVKNLYRLRAGARKSLPRTFQDSFSLPADSATGTRSSPL